MLKNISFLTLDIEEWYHANYAGLPPVDISRPTRLEELVDRLIEMCAAHGVSSTCFVLGEIALRKPAVVRKLHAAGHEIASHGLAHDLVYNMTPAQFRDDVHVACDALEQITGEKVLGYRAPSFSVRRETLPWYYETLASLGIAYSSSVFPGKAFLYGIPDFPREPHAPMSGVFEFPMPVMRVLGSDLGMYPRLWPAWVIRNWLRKAGEAGHPGIVYLHPREIDPDQPRLPLSGAVRMIHYWGLHSCEAKMHRVLGDPSLRFRRFQDVLPELRRE